jgi:hypothetical protein
MSINLALSKRIEERVQEFIATPATEANLRRTVRENRVLPLLMDMGGCLAIRTDGEIVSFVWEKEGTVKVENDLRVRNVALFQGSKKYPELEALMPSRAEKDRTCPDCKGTGVPPVALSPGLEGIVCYCGGVGWIPEGTGS